MIASLPEFAPLFQPNAGKWPHRNCREATLEPNPTSSGRLGQVAITQLSPSKIDGGSHSCGPIAQDYPHVPGIRNPDRLNISRAISSGRFVDSRRLIHPDPNEPNTLSASLTAQSTETDHPLNTRRAVPLHQHSSSPWPAKESRLLDGCQSRRSRQPPRACADRSLLRFHERLDHREGSSVSRPSRPRGARLSTFRNR